MRNRTLLLLVFLLSMTAASTSQAQAAQPTEPSIQLNVVIHDFNPNTELVNVSMSAVLSNFNSSASLLYMYVYSPYQGEIYLPLPKTGPELYSTLAPAESQTLAFQTASSPSDYPFDSYSLILNTTGMASGIPITVIATTPTGSYLSILTQWTDNAPIRTATGSIFTLTLTRNPNQSLTEILPVWVAFVLLGASCFIKPDKAEIRMIVLTSLFVFAPVYLLAIQSSIPLRFSPSIIEIQLSILLVGMGITGIASIFSSQTKVAGWQALADTIGAASIEAIFVLTTYFFRPSGGLFSPAGTMIVPLLFFILPAVVGLRNNYKHVRISIPRFFYRSR